MFRLRRQWRNRRARAYQQQGVLQEGRQRVHRSAFHLHRRRPVLPRGPAPAARWHARRDLHLRRRRPRLLRRPRARLGKADAHQGARLRRRSRARRGAAGICRAADLPELAGFSRRGSRFGNAPAHQRENGRPPRRRRSGLDIKLTPGGIRDIEFLVQCLQRLHGGREQWVRHGGTMLALFRLRDKGLLSAGEYARLAAAYQFLRYLEHRLQMEEDRQTHTLPHGSRTNSICWRARCRRWQRRPRERRSLKPRLDEHLAAVREIYERVIHAQKPLYYTAVPLPDAEEAGNAAPVSNLTRFWTSARRIGASPWPPPTCIAGASASSTSWKRPSPARRSADAAERRQQAGRAACSTFSSTAPISPTICCAIRSCWTKSASRSNSEGGLARRRRRAAPLLPPADAPHPERAAFCESEPIFTTLGKTSALADSVIAAAYRIARHGCAAAGQPGLHARATR